MVEKLDVGPETTFDRAVEIPTHTTVERARNYVAKMDSALSGSGGHGQTFKVAVALVRGFNLDPGTALSLLREYNHRCKPAWTEKDLRHKINEAVRKSQLAYGYILSKCRPE